MVQRRRQRLTRRRFLTGAAAAAGWLAASAANRALGLSASAAEPTPRAYLPAAAKRFPAAKVVHVHAAEATDWDFATGWYGDHVDQTLVNGMLERGLEELTGAATVVEAWQSLLPGYAAGEKIAVKVNLNNARSCADTDNIIDALIEPVNALIRSLVSAGVCEEDVWVYDASRGMPSRFYDRRRYTKATFLDASGCADERATFDHDDASLRVPFSHPAMQAERWLTDLLYRATYVINMPILKRHSLHPVTLGFKNHFGSLSSLGGSGDDNPHPYIVPTDYRYSSDFSPLVDINANPNIAAKTVLTVGDGLFGAPSVSAAPVRWTQTFGGDAPNSLLLSCDPVAIDSVMLDLLDAEFGVAEAGRDYLRLAEQRGLGVFEHGDPWGGYERIVYRRVEVTPVPVSFRAR
jgi:uncharacterized protein (DUF362 family)